MKEILSGKDVRNVTFVKGALVAIMVLLAFVFLQQAGMFTTSGARSSSYILDGAGRETRETRSAMESLRQVAAQKPWQEFGQCQSELEAVKQELFGLKGGSLDGQISPGYNPAQRAASQGVDSCSCVKCSAEGTQCTPEQLKGIDPSGQLAKVTEELRKLTDRYNELQNAYGRISHEKAKLDSMQGAGKIGAETVTEEAIAAAKNAIQECTKSSSAVAATSTASINAKGCTCEATEEELTQYFNYKVQGPCPDDWFFVQDLIFVKNCFSLPKRRCLSRTPRDPVPTLPFPQSLWDQSALDDNNVRWDLHHCKSFECLNTRLQGDCRNCFNLELESNRWKNYYRGAPSMADVIAMKNGTLRIGLDAGGGTGSFAAHMAKYKVTILTTAMDVETVIDRRQGMPYMEAIALRGLVPLHLPHKARLPFFDNTMDVVHSVNSIKYLSLLEFEELVMEWDRVLRPGGIMWFEMFYAPVAEMPLYIAILDVLQYKKLYWNHTPKPDKAERSGDHVYLNCVIEKPARVD